MTHGISEETLEIPGYRFEDLIGRGGMGSVYRAVQLAHSRPVAVKVLAARYRDSPEFVARFRREAELLAALEHPHIVPMLDAGTAGGVPYIVMRLIDGPNLRQVLRLGSPAPAEAIERLTGVAEALDFAHGRGVLHRDVKPHNMLLDHAGHVWLADFGLMQLADQAEVVSQARRLAGTFDYLAPELVAGASASVASDVYALAVTAFQLLTGELPFGAQQAAAVLGAQVHSPCPAASASNPALPVGIDSRLSEGMAADPAERPGSAGRLIAGLRDALELPARGGLELRPELRSARARIDSGLSGADASLLTSAETRSASPARGISAGTGAAAAEVAGAAGVSGAVAGLLAAVTAAAVLLGVGQTPSSPTAAIRLTAATGPVPTVFDYAALQGPRGVALRADQRVTVSCRVVGRSEGDDAWWYRIATNPWDQQYYAPAADFRGTPHGVDRAVPVCSSFVEVAGNAGGSYTWSNYRDAGGQQGAKLPSFRPETILCRVKGMKVPDGNVWWYRIGGQPWDGHFYISADAFYNNGETHGSLRGTAFVDLKVSLCGGSGPVT